MVSIEGGPGYSTTTDRGNRLALRRRRCGSGATSCSSTCAAPVARRRSTATPSTRARAVPRTLGRLCPAARRDGRPLRHARRGRGPRRRARRAAHGPVDLYGDSYGSYFAQDFALWHPRLLRTLVLDATYAVPGTDPFWRDLAQATRDAIVRACSRWPRCPVPPSQAIALVQGFVQQVRAHPFSGVAPDADGTRRLVRVDENGLVLTAFGGAFTYVVWRDLLAAVVAAEHGDRAPILRLVAENAVPARAVRARCATTRRASTSRSSATTTRSPSTWRRRFAVRAAQFAAAQASLPDALYAPFSAEAFTGTDYQGAGACLRWPAPSRPDPPGPAVLRYPDVPTLVLVGDLDTITPLADSAVVARRFPRGRLVVIRNQVHVTALADHDGCAARIVRRFVRVRSAGDTSCALRFAAVRVVGSFPRTVAAADPATRVRGDRSHAPRPACRRGRRRRRRRRAGTLADQLLGRRPGPPRRQLQLRGRRRPDVHVQPHAARARPGRERHRALDARERRGRRRPRPARRPRATARQRPHPLLRERAATARAARRQLRRQAAAGDHARAVARKAREAPLP